MKQKKYKIINRFLIIICCFIFFQHCAQEDTGIRIVNNTELTLELIGHSGFKQIPLQEIPHSTDTKFTNLTNYVGLALLRFKGGQTYPVYLNGKRFTLEITNPMVQPSFINSPENTEMYKWLNQYMQLQTDAKLLQASLEKLKTNDPLYQAIVLEQKRVEGKRLLKIKEINSMKHPAIKVLLQARILNESTYTLKTKDELLEIKKAYKQFVHSNLEYLFHSDMLMELVKQYFMMNEYVLSSNNDMYTQINTDVKDWIELLKPKQKAKEAVLFIIEQFYGRSMVTMSAHIIQNNRELLNKKVYRNSHDIQSLFEVNSTLPISVIRDSTLTNTSSYASLVKETKIISLIANNDVVAKVETVALARKLNRIQDSTPIIIVPKETLTAEHYALSKLFSGTLYYTKAVDSIANNHTKYFQFYLLDENNKVRMVTNNMNEIVVHLKKTNK